MNKIHRSPGFLLYRSVLSSCMSMHHSQAQSNEGQRTTVDSLGLKLQTTVSCHVGVAASALNYLAISPVPGVLDFIQTFMMYFNKYTLSCYLSVILNTKVIRENTQHKLCAHSRGKCVLRWPWKGKLHLTWWRWGGEYIARQIHRPRTGRHTDSLQK